MEIITKKNAFLLDLIEKGKNKSFTFGADEKKLFRLETREAVFPLFSINDIKEDTEEKQNTEDTEKEKKVFQNLKINVNIKKVVSFQFIKYIIEPLTIEDFTKIIKHKKILLFYLNIKDLKATTSTINPYDYKKVFKSIGKKQSNDAKVKKYK